MYRCLIDFVLINKHAHAVISADCLLLLAKAVTPGECNCMVACTHIYLRCEWMYAHASESQVNMAISISVNIIHTHNEYNKLPVV